MDRRQLVDRMTDVLFPHLPHHRRMQILKTLDTMGLVKRISRETSAKPASRRTSAKEVSRQTTLLGEQPMPARKDASKSTPARRRLGRGLTSLISTAVPVTTEEPPAGEAPPAAPPATVVDISIGSQGEAPAVRMVPTDQIRPSSSQPRQHFDEAALNELAASIKAAGLMQPIVVRPEAAGGFELVVGERRWRAAQLIGLASLPAVIREIDGQTAAEWALIENIQREDLNPLERADAFRRLTAEHGLTQRQVAERVGLDRSTVSNLLRLHELDDFTKDAIRNGLLSEAHGRALLAITNLEARQHLARLAIRQEWSLRHAASGRPRAPAPRSPGHKGPRQAGETEGLGPPGHRVLQLRSV
jgi:ParB family chromosome partitioning protein